jgi:hypothetical protein
MGALFNKSPCSDEQVRDKVLMKVGSACNKLPNQENIYFIGKYKRRF